LFVSVRPRSISLVTRIMVIVLVIMIVSVLLIIIIRVGMKVILSLVALVLI
jgi:hypothetical protein